MASSTSSTELFDSGPAGERPPSSRRRRRLAAGGTALVAVAGIGAAIVRTSADPPSPATGFLDSWIDAWNDRDAQQVSAMTCHYLGEFVPAGDIEGYLGMVPARGPVIGDYAVTATREDVVDGRAGVWITVSYALGRSSTTQERNVFVHLVDDRDPCIGYFSVW